MQMSAAVITPQRLLGLALLMSACSFPGVRPEGSTQAVTGTAPAARSAVYGRAKEWFTRFGWTVTTDVAGSRIEGHRTIARAGGVDTEAFMEFSVLKSTENSTEFRTFYYSRERAAGTSSVRPMTEPLLHDFLGCPSARWAGCP